METPKKLDRGMLLMLIGISLFLGFVLFAVAVGTIFPSVNKLSASLICNGEVQIKTTRYSYIPGETTWQHDIYCFEANEKKDITLASYSLTGLLASVIIFVPLVLRKRNLLFTNKVSGELASSQPGMKGTMLERLTQLKKMKDANLLSEAEYEQKKADIMKEL